MGLGRGVGMGLECTKCGPAIDRKGVDKDKIQPQRTKKLTNKDILVELVRYWSSEPFCNILVNLSVELEL